VTSDALNRQEWSIVRTNNSTFVQRGLNGLLPPILLVIAQLSAPCRAQVTDEEQSQSVATLEEVLVTGEHSGPGLWKVSKDDHVMWILGVAGPLPKKLIWRSDNVESLIAHSQEFVGPAGVFVKFDTGFFASLKAVPAYSRATTNPNHAKLNNILAPDLYAKWHVLKQKYVGGSSYMERLKPTFAATQLEKKAYEKSGFATVDIVGPRLKQLADKYKIKFTAPSWIYTFKIDNPQGLFDNVAKLQLDDLACFTSMIDQLEADLQSKRASANAWTTGNIAELTRLNQTPPAISCGRRLEETMLAAGDQANAASAQSFMTQVTQFQKRANDEAQTRWLAAAENALANNTTTFAVLSIYDLVSQQGRLSLLREKGYRIDLPQQ
jgi:TraB/PrgY/gumN family